MRPDGRQRWAVDEVLSWRGSGAGREAHVRWLGFDPETGEDWADSWEPRANLTSDLREGGRTRKRRSRAECEADEQRKRAEEREGDRRSRRVAGEGAEFGLDLNLRGML